MSLEMVARPSTDAIVETRGTGRRSAERQRDLSVVHVPGQDEVECSRWEKVEHVREVTEQDAQVCRVVDQAPRLGTTLAVRARVDADNLNTPPAHVDGLGLVDQKPRRRQIGQSGCA